MSSEAQVHGEARHPHLAHHFVDMEQQKEASTLAMWLFLATEILFFGGLFLGYTVYRTSYYPAWAFGSNELSFWSGTLMTAVLLCSSLTMAMALYSSQMGRRKATAIYLAATILLGLVFMGMKAVEYHEHWVMHEVPGPSFHIEPQALEHANAQENEVELFFSFYFAMTGLHALHMIIGVCLVGWVMREALRGRYDRSYHTPVEIVGLYWHFVDIIWIFLYPLLYLIDRHR